MTIKESNAQINKQIDIIYNSQKEMMKYFEKYKDEYREDRKTQQKFNENLIKEITTNKTDIKNMRRLPVTIAALASLISCVSMVVVLLK